MATAAGPKSVNDGLIYFIDPSNVKSYSGVGTVIYDLSGNGKTSYFTNGALYQNTSKGVVNVDGVNDYISTPLFNLTTPITISVWAKNTTPDSPIFSASGSGVIYGNSEYIFYYTPDNFNITVQGHPGGGKSFIFPAPKFNAWYNFVLTRDVTNNVRMYRNGVGSTSNPQSYSNTLQMNQIGRYSSFFNIYNPKGSIGEVKIYNSALSASEISQNYNATKKKYLISEEYVRDSLVLNLDFGNSSCYSGTGVTAYDLSGFGHTTYLINGASYNNAWGGNIFCDGVDDYIEAEPTSALEFGSNNFSVEYWYRKVEYTTGTDNIWGPGIWRSGPSDPSNNEWVLGIGSGESGIGESGIFYIQGTSSAFRTSELPLSYNLNKFNHMVGIRNNNQIQLYYNGILLQSTDFSGTFTTTTSVPVTNSKLRIGNSMLNSLYTKAHSGVVRIYRKALTADEVTQNYRALLPRFSDPSIVTDGLILNYDFGSIETTPRTGSSANNLVGTGFTATLVNSPTFGTGGGGTVVVNGTNQYLSSNDPGIALPLTISVWIYFNGLGGWNTFVCQDTTLAVPRAKFYFQRANSNALSPLIPGRINFTLTKSDGEVWVVNSKANPVLSTWINYTVVISSTQLKLYQDGVLQDSLSGSFSLQAGSGSVLYGAGYYSDAITDYSNVEFSRILIYNKALTENEISQNYNAMRYRF
jgi:hypothetical protein